VDPLAHPIVVVLAVAAFAPLIGELPIRLRLPLVVCEVLLGVAVGPFGLDLIEPNEMLSALAEMGLAALFFHAGLEIDFAAIRGRPLTLALAGWTLSLVLAATAAIALHHAGVVGAPRFVAAALTTTAIGALLPILRDAGQLEAPIGRYVTAAGSIGEFGPVMLLSLALTGGHDVGRRSALLLLFVLLAAVVAGIAMRARQPRPLALLGRTLHATSQLPVRLAVFVVGALFVLAGDLGLDVVLGAFAAGMVVGLAARGDGHETFREKMDAIGFGFFIPIFFIMSGVRLDVGALTAPASLARVPLYLLLMLIVRGTPALLYRAELAGPERLALALYSATGLPLIVAITVIGRQTGHMAPEEAAALVGAGMLSVLLFPLLGLSLATPRAR